MSELLPTTAEIASLIDHALLLPHMTEEELTEGLDLAAHYKVFSVCVQPSNVRFAVEHLKGTGVKVGTVIGFPHGATTTGVKVAEAIEAIRNGAAEVDMVINVGWVKSGQRIKAEDEIRQVVHAVRGLQPETIVKVILETSYLMPGEIALAAKWVEAAGADFVKTSTGFVDGGATLANLQIMRENVSPTMKVKASGGVRDLNTLLAMRDIGVQRFGTSATRVILEDLASRLATGQASGETHSATY